MLYGNDILSDHPDVELQSEARGYITKCNSPSGICYDILDTKYASRGRILGDFPRRKPRAKFYFKYITRTYRDIPGWDEFRRTEIFLPDDTPIFVNDCLAGHGHCSHLETMKTAELLEQYRSQEYRTKKPSKATPKRKIVKKVVKKVKSKRK